MAIANKFEKRDPNQKEPPNFSSNWVCNRMTEAVISRTGKCPDGSTSRLAKQLLFQRCVNLVYNLPGILHDAGIEKQLYEQVKLRAIEYQVCVFR